MTTNLTPRLGDVVLVGNRMAVVKYVGSTEFSNDTMYGIEIKGTPKVGRGHNGKVQNKQYFQCEQAKHGLFVMAAEINRVIPAEEILDKLAYIYNELRAVQFKFNKLSASAASASASGANSNINSQSQNMNLQDMEYVNGVTFIGSMMAGAVYETEGNSLSLNEEFKQLVLTLILYQLQKTKSKNKKDSKNKNMNNNNRAVQSFAKNIASTQMNKLDTNIIPNFIKKLMHSYCQNVKQITPVWKYFNFDFMDENLDTSNQSSDKKCFHFMKPYLCHKHCQWIKMDVVLGLFPNLNTICVAGVVLQDSVFDQILGDLKYLHSQITDDENDEDNEDEEEQKQKSGYENIFETENRLTTIEIVGPEMVSSSTDAINELNGGIIDSIIERYEMDFESIQWNIVKSSNKFSNEWVSIIHESIY